MLPALAMFAADTHPVLPMHTVWVGVMIILIAALFVAAAVIGPILRAHAPAPLPRTHSYDESPGASGRHGPGGTIRR